MDSLEIKVVRELNVDLVRDLNPTDIASYLLSKGCLTDEQVKDLICNDTTCRKNSCQKFLLYIVEQCPFQIFIDALRYDDTYPFLAESLEERLKNIKEECAVQKQDRDKVLVSVGKISIHNKHRRKLATLAHKLKNLSHDGDVDTFRQINERINRKFERYKLRPDRHIKDNMELADMRFVALEAEVSLRRVQYDVSLCESDIFKDMLEILPFTTNPTVSSMTYLARYASAKSMMESLEAGLGYLNYSKQHAEMLQPCKETGMVFYIEINLLSQIYEKNPVPDLKKQILQRTELAISHFNTEEEFGNDFHRMLLLKKVFCQLGIGLFGKRIAGVEVDSEDTICAESYLSYLEQPDIWNEMESRRKMLFFIAKCELCRRQGKIDIASMNAERAENLARKNGWKVELANIVRLIEELSSVDIKEVKREENMNLKDLLDDLLGSDSEDE
ncbi:hypothetical protein CHS0354_008169 [Potamilus streckersoni]|uniref:CARD domain-containing protein n=1 Tax=Potamilus streckersoni TaxID=2493646 RepID=A0AAE0RWI5_9BIVA|nr:hypothetical protein CHS0354_008169 [Potamilus streckersoni]